LFVVSSFGRKEELKEEEKKGNKTTSPKEL
jgi:hypothetical protein